MDILVGNPESLMKDRHTIEVLKELQPKVYILFHVRVYAKMMMGLSKKTSGIYQPSA